MCVGLITSRGPPVQDFLQRQLERAWGGLHPASPLSRIFINAHIQWEIGVKETATSLGVRIYSMI